MIHDNVPVMIDVLAGRSEELLSTTYKLATQIGTAENGWREFGSAGIGAADAINARLQQTEPILIKARGASKFLGLEARGIAEGFRESFIGAFTDVEGGASGMFGRLLLGWAQTTQQMALQASGAKLTEALFGKFSEQGKSEGGGLFGKIAGWLIGAAGGALGGGLKGAGGARIQPPKIVMPTPPVVTFGMAGGGFVKGIGTSTSDQIPALLSDGEYVIRAAAVQSIGKGFLDRINALMPPRRFAEGGLVDGYARGTSRPDMSYRPFVPQASAPPVQHSRPPASNARPVSITINVPVQPTAGYSTPQSRHQVASAIAAEIQHALRRNGEY